MSSVLIFLKLISTNSRLDLRATPTQRSGQRSEVEARNHGNRKEVDELATEASDHRSGEEVSEVTLFKTFS